MRKYLFLLLLVPFLGYSQNKTVVNTFRIFAKPGKTDELEKALSEHAMKYHQGDWKWRVFSIETGPDAGGYHVTEGPNSWQAIDGRGDISAEHLADWNNKVSPLVTERGSSSYSTFNEEMSTVALTDYTDKIIITHTYPKPGMVKMLKELFKKQKKIWEAGKESVAVYEAAFSGPPQLSIVNRLKNGLKELDPSFRQPMQERYNQVYGEGAWDTFLADYAKCVENRWSEMLFVRADLGSK